MVGAVKRRSGLLALGLLSGIGIQCSGPPPDDEANNRFEWVDKELSFREEFQSSSLEVSGKVVDLAGEAVPGATLTLGEATTQSDADGRYAFAGIPRQNRMLEVNAEGFRTEYVPLHLFQSLSVETLSVPPILLDPSSTTRMLFGGDVQLGRRFIDPEEKAARDELPPDDPNALIRVSEPLPGAEALLRHVRRVLSEADFTAVNLESVVTDDPATPDPDNNFVFFTLPQSLPALPWVGIDYVSLANNHIYDYFDQGLRDTLRNLADHSIPNSGVGLNIDEAFEPFRTDVRGTAFSLLSMVSIEGIRVRNATGATEERSGAADLNDDARINAALEQERAASRLPITMVHTGYEYMEEPPDDGYTVERLEHLIDAGAELVVAHHPHVPQGFQFHRGRLMAHSLGNLIFDQERLDTMFGGLLEVDWNEGKVARARVKGIYIEDFSPRFVAGARHDRLLRRLAASSARWGTYVIPYGSGALISETLDDFAAERRTISVHLDVDSSGWAVIDLRPQLAFGESLRSIRGDSPSVHARVGRDIMMFGDMEDMDIDDESMEVSRWYTSGLGEFVSTYVCQHDVHSGAIALCLSRKDTSKSVAKISFRNRIRVLGDKLNLPNKDLSLLGYTSADNAGPFSVEVSYYASFDGQEFGSEQPVTVAGGSWGWRAFSVDLDMPPDSPDYPRDSNDPYDPLLRTHNARALKVAFNHASPASGEGILRIDDIAVIAWEEAVDLTEPETLRTPHPRDFIRVEAPEGSYSFELEFERFVPRAAID